MLSALVRLRTDMVSRAELTRARSNLESEFVYRKETMQGQARLLGYSQCVFGDPNHETRYLGELAAVTREDIQRVAHTYLQPQNLTSVLVGPHAPKLTPPPPPPGAPWGGPPA